MPKKQTNMFGSFADAANDRAKEQAKIQSAVMNDHKVDPDNTENDKMTLSITKEDKAKLKIFAAKKGMTVSGLLRIWIAENCK